MTTLRVPGRKEPGARGEPVRGRNGEPLGAFGLATEVRDAVRVEAMRAGGDPAEVKTADDDVVELIMEGGARVYVRGSEVAERLRGATSRSLADPDTVDLAPALPLPARDRGLLGDWTIKGLRVLGVDLAGKTARSIAEAVEDRVVGSKVAGDAAKLCTWLPDRDLVPVDAALDSTVDGPWLLFLHGTASSTIGGFGGLAENESLWRRLHQAYPGRVLALEQRTLTRSPVDNTIQLLRQLPPRAALHVVSHSRGGLIGELLARGQRTGENPLPFDETDVALLGATEALGRLLAEKQVQLQRFVRVACPARGTTLASAKLDRWLNATLNVLGFAVETIGTPVLGEIYDGLQALLLAVVKERTDPATLPGLEAMIPGSPLMKLLNRPDVESAADLSVIEGDCDASGILQKLKLWFADAYYGEDHDLVVNTSSMSGGVRRTKARRFLDRGSTVDHFNYFRNARTADRVLAGLQRADADAGGYDELAAAEAPPMPKLRSRGALDTRPVVYVLHGITGSHLCAGKDRIWIDPFRLAWGGLARLAIDESEVTAQGLVGLYYGELCRQLDATHEVRPWPYDWRQPIPLLAGQFAQILRKAFEETGRPIRIVAHSMGGLVARSAFLDPEVWRQFRDRKGCRLIQLGTPNGGSFSIPMLLMGRNGLMGVLAAADLKLDRAEQLAIMWRWPGALQMLPHASAMDFCDQRIWADLALADGGDLDAVWKRAGTLKDPRNAGRTVRDLMVADLEAARKVQADYLAAPLDGERMFYIAGQAATVDGVTVDPKQRPGERILFTRTNEGDGQVLWRTGIPNGIKAWYTTALHGDLARHQPAIDAVMDLLGKGTTTRLPTEPGAVTRGKARPPSIAREEPPIQPGAEDIAVAALGATPVAAAEAAAQPITIRVVHGNLALARYPMMVGHYPGDSLDGSEAALDRALDGRLQERRRMGLYPGPIATSTVVLDMERRPRGAVVVGLGEPGSLAIGLLQRTLQHGLLSYAAAEADRRCSAKDQAGGFLSLSTVLVGAGDGGLGRSACVLALLRAAACAQIVLTSPADPGARPTFRLSFGEIEIIELFEDRALEIWHAIRVALDDRSEFAGRFALHGEVVRQGGARRRLMSGERGDWWLPIQITMASPAPSQEKVLRYTVAGGLARAESQLVGANLDIVRSLLRRSIDGSQAHSGGVSPSRALFELLWPVRLKEFSEDDRNLRMVLDEDSAQFPWELMDDRRPWGNEGLVPDNGRRRPAAVRAGVVRQLIQTRFREYVVTPRGSRRALVIGDPRGRPMDGFAELPGARREAQAVADRLRATHDVTALIGDDVLPEHVVMHLFAEAWEIIHIAAHGVVREPIRQPDGTEPLLTGVVLGAGVVLGPSVLAQLSVSPELFFLNCCHLGRVDPQAEEEARQLAVRGDRPELAASVAVELIRNGVRGVIAAGWAVDDDAAESFATTFYERMEDADDFGEATRKARASAYGINPTGTTWGAYQCYGEPDMRLPGRRSATRQESRKQYHASVAEIIALAEQITEDLNVGLERNTDAMRKRLAELEGDAGERAWNTNAELRVAFAEARAELGDLKEAIAHYEVASRGTDTKFKVRAIEQLANLAARHAGILHRASERPSETLAAAVASIEDAQQKIERLMDILGPTPERWSLRGSCWKRLAQIQTGGNRRKALARMAEAYGEAGKLSPAQGKAYPEMMRATASILIHLRDTKKSKLPEDVQPTLRAITDAGSNGEVDFWSLVARADAKLLLCIAAEEIEPAEERAIVDIYRQAWRHVGSPVKLMSTLEQITFLNDVLAESEGRTELLAALGRIGAAVETAMWNTAP